MFDIEIICNKKGGYKYYIVKPIGRIKYALL